MEKKKLKIAVFGPSGVGKSTLLNMFANCVYYTSYQEALKDKRMVYVAKNHFLYTPEHSSNVVNIYIPTASSDHSDAKFSQTKSFNGYEILYKPNDATSISVTLIDSPGTMHIEKDSDPKDKDDEYINMVVDYLSTYETIDAFLILVRADTEKLTPEFQYCIDRIFNQLDKSAKENVLFGFTGCGLHQFTAPNAENALKGLGYELHENNKFYFDNMPVRELAVLQNGYRPRQNTSAMNVYWRKTSEEFVRMLKHVSTLPAYEVQKMVTIQDIRSKIEMLVPYLVHCTIDADFTMKQIEKAEKNEDKVKKFKEKTTKPLFLPNRKVVCTNKECCKDEVIEKTETVETRQEGFRQWCCENCWLKLGTEHTTDLFFLQIFCGSMGLMGACKICSHPVKEHMQINYLMIYQVQLKEAVADELKAKYESLEYEKQTLLNACATLNTYLKHHAFKSSESPFLKAIRRVIKKSQEKMKAADSLEENEVTVQVSLKLETSYNVQNDLLVSEKIAKKEDIKRVFQKLQNLKRIGNFVKEFCAQIDENRHKVRKNGSKEKYHRIFDKDDLPKLSLVKGLKQMSIKETSYPF